jgi:phage terminase large subunit-like protein
VRRWGLLEERQRLVAQRLFFALYPDETTAWSGPSIMGGLIAHGQKIYARELYSKHLEFFRGGATHIERCLMAANRSGKTLAGGYEVSCHLTGLYPKWWDGRRFTQPVSIWVAGDTYETTRDILQLTLLGEVDYRGARKVVDGRGVIPGHLLGDPIWRQGVQNLVDTIPVQHKSGGRSLLGLKSYDQGRKAFQGTGKHVVWLDEEPPMDVYNECLIRTATLHGLAMLTFTPLMGLSEVVLSFLPADQRPDLSG